MPADTLTSLQTLEPRGARFALTDLLRWRLAAPLLRLAKQRSGQLAGSHRSSQRGRGIDFEEVRLYQPGDDVRSIDWRVTARSAKPHTKVFREERERPVILLVDLRSTMFFGSRRCFKSVVAAHAAALVAWATLDAGDRIGALIVSDSGIVDIKPRRSRHTVLRIIQQMLTVQAQRVPTQLVRPAPLLPALQQLRAVLHPGASAVLIGDFHDWDDDCKAALSEPARHCQCLAVQISDALEQALPAVGIARLWSGARTAIFDTGNRTLSRRYEQQRLQTQQTLQQGLQALKIPLLTLATDSELFPALRQFLSRTAPSPHTGASRHGR